jgi:threonine/homoserine/homoserine lactone efflux protein
LGPTAFFFSALSALAHPKFALFLRGHLGHLHGMSADLVLALVLFAFASSITPGPNNIMLLASGANFGLTRTVPHMLGISLGHAVMVALIGLGLLQLFEALPWLRPTLMAVCAAYLLYLAWKIATAAAPDAAQASGRPFTFVQAAAFQWVNPKAWYMAIYAQTHFAPAETGIAGALLVPVVFALVNLPSVALWAAAGTQLRRWLAAPGRLRVFNIAMALMLVASLYPMLRG